MNTTAFRWAVGCALICAAGACGDDEGTADSDGGLGDGAVDAGGERCAEDSDCDDGLYCNGEERCEGQRCVAGEPIACDDDIACTRDVCSEEREECLFVAPDEDGDGHQDRNCLDADGEPFGDDCDDTDGQRFPGNPELCDEEDHDEDCDPETFGVVDRDGDGFRDARCCNEDDEGNRFCGNDCDDVRPNVSLLATETCDAIDNDCDGEVDETVSIAGFVDGDRDGYGDTAQPVSACPGEVGFAVDDGDCDDADISRHPAQLELCDSVDNDCDGEIDEEENIVNWYADLDTDGYGSAANGVVQSCAPVAGHSLLDTDCDDDRAAISPLAAEMCDGVDNDCNGEADFAIGVNDFEDDDGDGLVDIQCSPLGTDCDDRDALTGPGTDERCDGRDNDCDGNVDEGGDGNIWFLDLDGDGYGAVTSGTTVSCQPVPGYVRQAADCDDENPLRNPGAAEVCNGLDDNCDTLADNDAPAPAGCTISGGTAGCVNGACGIGACGAGFGDCDDNAANGCEADLSLPETCGSCANRCFFANGFPACIGGACELGTCQTLFGDCDGNKQNGCETFLGSEQNCGSCGMTCLLSEGKVCAAGNCLLVDCPPGTEDCDGDPTNGCEVTLGTVANCNGCGDVCSSNNGTPSCLGDRCSTACNAGYGDCNNNPFDGCETNLNDSVTDCGFCGAGCFAPNTNFTCNLGRCEIMSCTGDFENCDSDIGNGCETDTQGDIGHCGGCNMPCFVTGADPVCNSGNCEIGSCFPDFRDCNGAPTDGCEIDIFNDPANCNGCGNVCSAANAIPACNGGVCGFTECIAGFSDCDAMPGNGCEVDAQVDPLHCGQCGRVCGFGRSCFGGTCERILEIVVGTGFSCVLGESGQVACWGRNDEGQLGNGTTTPSVSPVIVEQAPTIPLNTARSLAAGHDHVCAVTDGGVFCWGNNGDGKLGDGTAATRQTRAVAVMNLPPDVFRLALGFNHSCGLTSGGKVHCWGSNDKGQLGNGASLPGPDVNPPSVSPIGALTAVAIAAGDSFSCAINDMREVTCWGTNGAGQLGTGSVSADEPSPVPFAAGIMNVNEIFLGKEHGCLIRTVAADLIECWGSNATGQLGVGSTGGVFPPTAPAAPVLEPRRIYTGNGHTCALDRLNRVQCWGDNSLGQIATGTLGGVVNLPSQIGPLGGVDLIPQNSPLADHALVLQFDDFMFGWGSNGEDELGVDTGGTAQSVPINVPGI